MPTFDLVAAQELPQSCIIYGPPFSGKTHMCAELANEGYTLHWFDLQQGRATLRNAVQPENYSKINYYYIPQSTKNNVAMEVIGRLLEARGPIKFCEEHGKYMCQAVQCKDKLISVNPMEWTAKDVLVVDCMTELNDSTVLLATNDRQEALYRQAFKLEFDDYGYQRLLLNKIMQNIQNRNFHRLFIAHDDIIEQNDGTKIIQPAIGTRNFSATIGGKFDHMIYCYMENKKQKAACGNGWSSKIMTGTRGSVRLEDGKHRLVDVLRCTKDTNSGAEAAKAEANKSAAASLMAGGAKRLTLGK